MRPLPIFTILLAVLAPLACGDPSAERDLPPDRFVEVNVELRLVDEMGDTESERDDLREEVLARHGVTPDDLERFVEMRRYRLDELAAVWTRISEGVDSARVEADLPMAGTRPRVPEPD